MKTFLCALLLWRSLSGGELSFDKLAEATSPQEGVMRGFLYRTDSGEWVLAAEPNLKSCCIGAKHTREKQIFVEGDVGQPEPGRVYQIKGVFSREAVNDGPLYQLRHVSLLIPQNYSQGHIFLLLSLFSVLLLTVRFFLSHFKKK